VQQRSGFHAARTGVSDSAVIEASLCRDLKLDVLDELWANATRSEAKASELAVEAHTPRGRADGHLVRAVVDVNVLISGVLPAKGSSAEVLRASRDGQPRRRSRSSRGSSTRPRCPQSCND
jgi:hypothetical protein